MKETLLKILSVVIISTLSIITFLLGMTTLGEGKHLFKPYIDTHFATDYSPEKFNQVQLGMTLEEVTFIIGNPLYKSTKYNDSTKINYYYTGDGKLLSKAQEQGRQDYDDCAWYRSTVTIDTNNIVVEIDKGWSYD